VDRFARIVKGKNGNASWSLILSFRRKSRKMLKGIQVSQENFLKARPVHNPGLDWNEDQKRIHITIPRKKTFLPNILVSILPSAREKRIVLDEQGSFIWKLCDGKTSIRSIAENLNTEYNMPISRAEAALDVYFVQLSKKGLVGFILPQSTRKRYARKFGDLIEDKEQK